LLLGCWLSKAFLAYIRPQVLEWTNNMSMDMTQADSFLFAGNFDQANPAPHAFTQTGSMALTRPL
jgi:hypothetical protein